MRSRLFTSVVLLAVLVGLVGSVAVPQLPAPPPSPVVVLHRPADRTPAPARPSPTPVATAPEAAPATLDDRGILEMQLAAYDPHLGAIAVDDPLPEASPSPRPSHQPTEGIYSL